MHVAAAAIRGYLRTAKLAHAFVDSALDNFHAVIIGREQNNN